MMSFLQIRLWSSRSLWYSSTFQEANHKTLNDENCLSFERFWCVSGGLSADQLCKNSISSVTETRI